MPEQNGLDATRQIRQQSALQDIPIIAISASVGDETRHQSSTAGCNDFITKPFLVEEVLDTLQRHLPLVWLSDKTPEVQASAAVMSAIKLPPQEELQRLLFLARIGDVAGVEEKVAALQKKTPDYDAFAVHLTQFITAFELEPLEQFIQEQLEGQ
jgi:DNA-binding NtrC family response regulator